MKAKVEVTRGWPSWVIAEPFTVWLLYFIVGVNVLATGAALIAGDFGGAFRSFGAGYVVFIALAYRSLLVLMGYRLGRDHPEYRK